MRHVRLILGGQPKDDGWLMMQVSKPVACDCTCKSLDDPGKHYRIVRSNGEEFVLPWYAVIEPGDSPEMIHQKLGAACYTRRLRAGLNEAHELAERLRALVEADEF